jgi:hypothetical protein
MVQETKFTQGSIHQNTFTPTFWLWTISDRIFKNKFVIEKYLQMNTDEIFFSRSYLECMYIQQCKQAWHILLRCATRELYFTFF